MADYTGSFSGSYEGNGSGLTNIDYYNLSNLPTTITPFQKNSILANNSIRDNFVSNVKARLDAENVISSSAQLTTEFDIRYGNETGDDLVSGSAQIVSLLPNGVVSGSSQLPSGLISGSSQLPEGIVSASNQIVEKLPDGVVSGSSQITSVVTDNYISASAASSGFGDAGAVNYNELQNIPSGIISGSSQLPSNVISSSAQITALGYSTTDNDSQTLSLVGQTLSISSGNSVSLAGIAGGGGSGGASIWNTGSQDPESYTKLMTQNNLEVTGSVDIKGDFTVNGQSVFTQTSASDAGNAIVVNGRLKVLEETIGSYIASASIQVGNTQDTIDCGGFF